MHFRNGKGQKAGVEWHDTPILSHKHNTFYQNQVRLTHFLMLTKILKTEQTKTLASTVSDFRMCRNGWLSIYHPQRNQGLHQSLFLLLQVQHSLAHDPVLWSTLKPSTHPNTQRTARNGMENWRVFQNILAITGSWIPHCLFKWGLKAICLQKMNTSWQCVSLCLLK